MCATPLLIMKNISKSFPGVKALEGVDFTLQSGEIHCLMGENGAGKSTLIKLLTGVYRISEGEMLLSGKPIHPRSPLDAQNMSISTVYQEVNLLPNQSVAENICIGRVPRKFGLLDRKSMIRKAKEILEWMNIDIDVTQPVSNYSLAIQQMVSIARALDIKSKILILDEPTSSLDTEEVEQLFKLMRKLKDEGMGIIFITHFLDQVYEISEKITVLRNGKLVGEYTTENLPRLKLISKMIGKEFTSEHVKKEFRNTDSNPVLINMEKGSVANKIEEYDIKIRKGEVYGLAGLLGSGRTELARSLFGLDRLTTGELWINDEPHKGIRPIEAIRNGMGFCPEDRKEEAIIPDLSISENLVLALQSRKGVFNKIKESEIKEIVNHYIDALSIKATGPEQKISTLSGGNQQKVILARWLAVNPSLLILDEPTRGIDIGAKSEVMQMIKVLSKKEISILFISSELEEVTAVSDRIAILKDRRIIGEQKGNSVTERNILNKIAEVPTL
ncbi:MAG: sugar ABC transporter ATP-binding protein [Spirochaetaceae bacterium 4572_59]|nr:MAG: sugar ABC transporter ATP-binding protein [Spirochaetaceae bacterium 4572_59]